MDESTVRQQLNELSAVKETLETLLQSKQKLIEQVMPPVPDEVKEKLKEIDAEFAPNERSLQQRASELDAQIRLGVVSVGHSVIGDALRGTFVKGQVKWLTDGLDAYIIDHPDLGKFRTQKPPTCRVEKT